MFVFVVGTGRCGTTLVHELLCRHPDVGFISNVDDTLSRMQLPGAWNGRLFRRGQARAAGLRPLKDSRTLLERGRLRVAPSEGWRLLDRQVMSGFSRPCRDLVEEDATPWVRERLRGLFTDRLAAQRADVLVHRLTGWPRTGLIAAALPEARFIHVVRDGRAVANSWLQMGWWDGYRGPDNWYLGPIDEADRRAWERSGRSFPVLAALGWQLLIRAFEEARDRRDPAAWFQVRYEDLLAQPEVSLERLLAFTGLDRSPEWERGVARHAFDVGRANAYRRDLGEDAVRAIETAIGRTLARYGYPPVPTAVSAMPSPPSSQGTPCPAGESHDDRTARSY
jgi:hypothetical protein